MGYETNLILLEKFPHSFKYKRGDGIDAPFASVVGMIDLCKAGDRAFHDKVHRAEKYAGRHIYFYLPGNGDTAVVSDPYGKKMKAFPAKRMLRILKEEKEQEYRRFKMAIPLLEQFVKEFGTTAWVVCYGH